MAKRNKLIVIVDGIENSRESASRTYTHVIVGRYDVAGLLAEAQARQPDKTDRSNYEYHLRHANAQPDVPFTVTYKGTLGGVRSYEDTKTAEQIAEAKEIVRGGFDAYYARQKAKSVARVQAMFDEAQAAGFPRTVLQWSMSEANAQKGVNQWRNGRMGRHLDVSVLAVADILKPVAVAA
jgi:hypothetical protein